MKLRDKYGWPVEVTRGHHINNFIRLLIHTNLKETWKRRKINYRELKGHESKDKWGNRTKIIDVDSDVVVIATYRKHCHDTCITRQIWRDDYYTKPTLLGGHRRFKKELRLCGFKI